MKIISWNINGIRAINGKGFLGWLEKSGGDVVCLQEIKATEDKIPAELKNPAGYFSYFNPAQRPGYSGVAAYTKQQPLEVINKIGFKQFDEEGRILRLEYPDFILINVYMPNGGQSAEALDYKLEVYEYLLEYLGKIKKKPVVIVGDFNVAREEIDLARPKENQNSIMFTPPEREKLDKLVKLGFVDSWRYFYPTEKKYTWWHYFSQSRIRNIGWRIDCAFVSPALAPKLKGAEIYNEIIGSDHCPIEVEI
ncbi:MAG: Exodeoxyribonuclease III [Parcubacteria group bacterium GW2011_GWA2_42_11]|nr:MAG: Exodeoxyribonuclease III [Parcubacteria group bacterium GW2011_GWA2_42_11]